MNPSRTLSSHPAMLGRRVSLALLPCAALVGCASTPSPDLIDAASPSQPSSMTVATVAEPPAADREAILAMLGEYRVTFAFDETVVLQPDYERKEDKRSGAHEVVVLVEDSPGRIVLQHLLVGRNGHVTKHWRQDWLWQAEQRLEFSADQTWTLRPVPAALTESAWTQCVYEVSDAPRYCGTGRWNHRYGNATWTSDRSWRPLPRREYTQREDYNALNVENRHTITPHGWTHEQDNTKVKRAADGSTQAVLVREFGFNDYRRIEGHDFGPAYRYWEATADYWARVRAEWDARIQAWGGVHLDTAVDGMPMIVGTFTQAGKEEKGEAVDQSSLVELFDRHVVRVGGSTAQRARAPGREETAVSSVP